MAMRGNNLGVSSYSRVHVSVVFCAFLRVNSKAGLSSRKSSGTKNDVRKL